MVHMVLFLYSKGGKDVDTCGKDVYKCRNGNFSAVVKHSKNCKDCVFLLDVKANYSPGQQDLKGYKDSGHSCLDPERNHATELQDSQMYSDCGSCRDVEQDYSSGLQDLKSYEKNRSCPDDKRDYSTELQYSISCNDCGSCLDVDRSYSTIQRAFESSEDNLLYIAGEWKGSTTACQDSEFPSNNSNFKHAEEVGHEGIVASQQNYIDELFDSSRSQNLPGCENTDERLCIKINSASQSLGFWKLSNQEIALKSKKLQLFIMRESTQYDDEKYRSECDPPQGSIVNTYSDKMIVVDFLDKILNGLMLSRSIDKGCLHSFSFFSCTTSFLRQSENKSKFIVMIIIYQDNSDGLYAEFIPFYVLHSISDKSIVQYRKFALIHKHVIISYDYLFIHSIKYRENSKMSFIILNWSFVVVSEIPTVEKSLYYYDVVCIGIKLFILFCMDLLTRNIVSSFYILFIGNETLCTNEILLNSDYSGVKLLRNVNNRIKLNKTHIYFIIVLVYKIMIKCLMINIRKCNVFNLVSSYKVLFSNNLMLYTFHSMCS